MFEPADLNSHGFAICRQAVAEAELEGLRAGWEALPTGRAGVRNVLDTMPAALRFATSKAARSIAESVLGPNVMAVRAICFDKTAETNWKVPWHQDLSIAVQSRVEVAGYAPWSVKEGVTHVQAPEEVLAQMLAIRVHLDDSQPEQGCLRVLPGSHRSGSKSPRQIETAAREIEPVECSCFVGDVAAIRPLLIHGSSVARVPSRRRVLHIEYAAA